MGKADGVDSIYSDNLKHASRLLFNMLCICLTVLCHMVGFLKVFCMVQFCHYPKVQD